jgi:hypothetical protein
MSDSRVLRVTWAETGALSALDGTKATLQRLQAIVGRLVAKAVAAGELGRFAPQARLPAIGEAGHDVASAMQDVVDRAADSGQFEGTNLPLRAVLWEISPDGAPRNADPALPLGCEWMTSPATRRSDFKAPDGRYFRLFESDVLAPPRSPAWVSGYTRSGLATGGDAAGRLRVIPVVLGGVAAVLFFYLVACLAWSGLTTALAYDAMAIKSAERAPFLKQLLTDCAGADKCFGMDGTAISDAKGVEDNLKGCLTPTVETKGGQQIQSMPVMQQSPFCTQSWREATQFAAGEMGSAWRVFNAVLGWPVSGVAKGGGTALGPAMVGLMLSVALLGIAAGLATERKVFGVWISPQNRISLSRVQVSVWTIVVLGAYAALAAFNAGMMAHLFETEGVESVVATAGRLFSGGVPFPDIPGWVLATLGIAVTSSMASAVLKGDAAVPSLASGTGGQQTGFAWRYLDRSDNFPPAAGPSFADLFTGETEGDTNAVDVSRLQNLIVTFILVTGYLSLLLGMVQHLAPDAVALAFLSSRPVFNSLPDPGGTFNVLLLGSHAAYIVSKASGGAQASPD